MKIWSAEIKEIEGLHESFKGQFPDLEKELEQLIRTEDENVVMLYSRRSLEIIITELCKNELKRPRGTEPLKGIIDKLSKESKVPPNIITSMHGLNDLATYGTHPKDFDPEQVKPVLVNLDIIIKWYLKYQGDRIATTAQIGEELLHKIKTTSVERKRTLSRKNKTSLILSGIILLALIITALLYFTNTIGSGRSGKGLEKSIAILPFRNDTPVDSNKYFIDGVMEDILNDLQKIKDLRVISRTSVEQYRNTTKTIPVIAKELGVNYIVEGSGEKSGNAFRLSSQLLRAKKESHLWGKTFEQELHDAIDVFRIQSQIAESIASELQAAITPQEKQLIDNTPTSNLGAYENCILGGSYLSQDTKEDNNVALQYYEKAKEIDPDYADAYLGIMAVWIQRAFMSWATPEEAFPIAKAHSAKAAEIDSTRWEIYLALGATQMIIDWDFKGAEKSFLKLFSLDPNNSGGHLLYGQLLSIFGRYKEALEQEELALKLDPMSLDSKSWIGLIYYCSGKNNDAVKVFQEVLIINSGNIIALSNLPLALHELGRYNEELEAWKAYYSSAYKGYANVFDQGYAKGGYPDALSFQADSLAEQLKIKFCEPSEIAHLYACAGSKERTLDMLEYDYEVHDPNLSFDLRFPIYEFIHNEPRYQDLLRKMNLPLEP
jgi:TolB-like protein